MKVLGINYSLDAGACLVVDGRVVGAVAEERFSRIKHDGNYPASAVNWCLEHAGLTMADVDRVAFFWNPGIHCEPSDWRMTGTMRDHKEYLYALPAHLMRSFDGQSVQRMDQTMVLENGHALTMHYIAHHDCHAAAAFFRSNFAQAAVLTVDGYGERASTQISVGSGSQLKRLATIDFPHSVGAFYAAFTQYLGFRPNNGEGKVMGLASYGKPRFVDAIRSMVCLTNDGFELDLSYFSFYLKRTRRYADKLVNLLGPERKPGSEITTHHQDIAASLQQVTEEILLHLTQLTRTLTGESNLCMAGGVVLNCVANSRIRYESDFDDVYFMPAAGDTGTSMGAALYVSHVLGAVPRATHPQTDALGPSFTDDAIEVELLRAGVSYVRSTNVTQEAAQLLSAGKIIGWFQGPAELGPRALGHRSILADPRSAEMKDTLNARVKFREGFRPFAPAVLAEECGNYFARGDASPYMLLVYDTLPEKRDILPAITHVDGGARVQTVTPDENGPYYDLIAAFGQITGVPVILNTSFNIRGEPIVNSVADALKCYATTGLDALVVGSFILRKGD
jgi:carbamoyltransferase